MKSRSVFFAICLSLFHTASGQGHILYIQEQGSKAYLLHHVVAKENWYSVGRIYNISPKELAPFNGLTLEQPLVIGQELKVPLTPNNFSQDGKKNADETFVPVYHEVRGEELLPQISANFNRVPITTLEKWNKVSKEAVKDGMRLVVGFLKVKSSLSYLANEGARNADVAIASHDNANPPQAEKINLGKPSSTDKPLAQGATARSTEPGLASANENKPLYVNNGSNHFKGGYFASDFNDGNNLFSGLAGTFKSTSGWNDGKYYVLVNNIPVGTIVKIIAPATQKSVFAKVLGQMPEMKESEGLSIRISNAACAELGESEGKFNVQVKY